MYFGAADDGSTDWATIRSNFSNIQDVINSHASEISAQAKHQTITISRMFSTRGKYVLAEAGKHPRAKVTDGYVILHDNIDQHIEIDLLGPTSSILTQPVKFNGSEKKGSGKPFTIMPRRTVHFKDRLSVLLSENRRVSVYLTLESLEELK